MSSSGDSEGTYQDDIEDMMIAAGQTSKDRRKKAKEEKDKKIEGNKQEASKQVMFNAGQSSHDRRKGKKEALGTSTCTVGYLADTEAVGNLNAHSMILLDALAKLRANNIEAEDAAANT
ncbi:hypothetical protein TruAng_004731 [Truncatella angustata]|nr:hypothetical protein TruAng_004731 [Truncatella angustata]